MAHSTNAQVLYLINTSVSTGDIDNMITLADAELDALLGGASMDANLLALCSARLVAIMLAGRDPNARSVGGSEMDFGQRVNQWRRFVDQQVRIATKDIRVQ